jgi:PTS system fructose-specific IIC component
VADGIDWGAKDGPAKLVFLIAAPEGRRRRAHADAAQARPGADEEGLQGGAARRDDPGEVVDIVSAEVALDPAPETSAPRRQPAATATATATSAAAAPTAAAAGSDVAGRPRRVLTFVGVTSCPTGIAHTYMAAEALERRRQGRRAHDEGRDPGLGRLDPAEPRPRSPPPTP